jgi:hypothetical protein
MKTYKFTMNHKLEPEDCPKCRGGGDCDVLPRSPDLTPCDFFLWVYVKEKVCVPPLPLDIDELKLRITAAVETVDMNMSKRV